MNWLENTLSPELVRAVGWTIVHSLWQGAVVGLALVGLLLVLRRHSAQVRYNVAGLALVTLLGLTLATFGRHYALALAAQPAAAAATATVATTNTAALNLLSAATTAGGAANSSVSLLETGRVYFDQHLPLIVAVWFLGLLAMTLRLLGGLAYVQRLRHYRVEPLSEQWNERFKALANRAGIKRTVTLLESALVKAPLVAGHLKPVILLPLGTVMGLSHAQLEAILAHELAHIARRDYLMNILQSMAEILFFYHPAVWFITACLRTERENCCDDEATAICGDPLTLAKALAALAEMGQDVYPAPRLALSAVGPDGSLMGRIRRLVQRRAAPTFSEGFMAALVVIGGLALIGLTTVVSMASPRPWPEKAKALVGAVFGPENSVWANSLPSFETTAAAPVASLAGADDDEDKKKRKSKSKDDKHTVIVRDANAGETLRGGRNGETVIVKRDKKGRVTELYVDGQRIDMDEGKQKAKGNSTEIIRLAPASRRRTTTTVQRSYDSDSRNYGMSARDQEDLRRSMQNLERDLGRNDIEIRRGANAYVLNDGGRVEVRTGKSSVFIDADKIAHKALLDAERALRQAERTETDHVAREEIRLELGRIEERRNALRERQEGARERVEENVVRREESRSREVEQADRERAQADRERAQAERERAQAEREKARAERDKARAIRDEQNRKAEEAIINELVKDNLIKDRKYFQFVLNAKELVVDGQKQPEAVASKYRKLFEDGTGRTLGATGSVVFSNTGGNVNRIYSNGASSSKYLATPPTPPAPPAAPAAPRAPRTGYLPTPPTPPRPPRAPRNVKVNSVALGDQLRKDGLIDQNARSFQLQLNALGMTVNGQKQPQETAKRYRQLLGKSDGEKFNMDVVITE